MLAAILTIGNELVSGDTENTNASWLARRLESLGVQVVLSAAVPDETDRIVEFLRREAVRVDHLIVTGGLGGTPDDITRESLAAAFGVPQVVVSEPRRRPACAFPRRPGVRGAVGSVAEGFPPAREPARRRARLPDRECLGAAGAPS